jgi:four helix bundle protein
LNVARAFSKGKPVLSFGAFCASFAGMGVRSIRDLRAWQTCRAFKLAVYRLVQTGRLADDRYLREQLRESAASATSQIAEGFGRFSPADFGRFLAMTKASLIEAQNHLQDAVDRGYITEACRLSHDELAKVALRDVTALLEYLQSSKARKNALEAREKREASRRRNHSWLSVEPAA